MTNMSEDWAAEKPRAWECYNAGPIDFAWHLLPTVEEVAQRLVFDGDPECLSAAQLLSDFDHAKRQARTNGWEGDFAERPRVFFLPKEDECSFVCAFAWKQQNNGVTLVVSPLHLPWLSNI